MRRLRCELSLELPLLRHTLATLHETGHRPSMTALDGTPPLLPVWVLVLPSGAYIHRVTRRLS